MKIISYLAATFVLMFSLGAHANKDTKSMLDQVSSVSTSWHPTVSKVPYRVHKKSKDIVVMCFYDSNANNADPDRDDAQAVFIKSGDGYKLVAVVFSSVDRVLENIDILVP